MRSVKYCYCPVVLNISQMAKTVCESVSVLVFDTLLFNASDLVWGHKTRIIKHHAVGAYGTTLKFTNNKCPVLCTGNFNVRGIPASTHSPTDPQTHRPTAKSLKAPEPQTLHP